MIASPAARPASVRIAFASGANASGEMLGFAATGIAPGCALPEIRGASQTTLRQFAGTDVPVFVDSGAFSEVSFKTGKPVIVAPITDEDWQDKLAVYRDLAQALGPQLTCVAPDLVGHQDETLARLKQHKAAVQELVALGARVLVVMQKGKRSQVDFWRECQATLECAVVPSLPMKKAATTTAEAIQFLREVQPPDIHLLGFGLKNDQAGQFFKMAERVAPDTSFSVDANLITASVGRHKQTRKATRILTATQDEIRTRGLDDPDVLECATWGLYADWTELASDPEEWTSPADRRRMAEAAGLSSADMRLFRRHSAVFLQRPFEITGTGPRSVPSAAPLKRGAQNDCFATPEAAALEDDAPRWWEWEPLAVEIEREFRKMTQEEAVQPRKALAITMAFADHPAAGQFAPPERVVAALESAARVFGEPLAEAQQAMAERSAAAEATTRPGLQAATALVDAELAEPVRFAQLEHADAVPVAPARLQPPPLVSPMLSRRLQRAALQLVLGV